MLCEVEPSQGSDCICLPSTEIGDILKEPSTILVKDLHWNCIIAGVHEGLVAIPTSVLPNRPTFKT